MTKNTKEILRDGEHIVGPVHIPTASSNESHAGEDDGAPLIQPLPWTAECDGTGGRVYDANGFLLAGDGQSLTADEADFIVRACNSHDELLAALKHWVMAIDLVATDSYCEVCNVHAPKDDAGHVIGPLVHYGCPFDQARAAITKAED